MNPINWIEVPVTDMDRAIKCYNCLFDWELTAQDVGPLKMAWFPSGGHDQPGATGTLVLQESYVPSQEGALVYFSSPDVQIQVDRIEDAGGKLLVGKRQISPEHGFMAAAIDSEGNRIAFHSNK